MTPCSDFVALYNWHASFYVELSVTVQHLAVCGRSDQPQEQIKKKLPLEHRNLKPCLSIANAYLCAQRLTIEF